MSSVLVDCISNESDPEAFLYCIRQEEVNVVKFGSISVDHVSSKHYYIKSDVIIDSSRLPISLCDFNPMDYNITSVEIITSGIPIDVNIIDESAIKDLNI